MGKNGMTIQQFVDRQSRIDAAWERFDSVQEAREKEIRGGSGKVKIMSNEEWDRLQKCREIIDKSLQKFWEVTLDRNRGIRSAMFDYLSTNKMSHEDDQVINSLSKKLALNLSLYLQAYCDPYLDPKTSFFVPDYNFYAIKGISGEKHGLLMSIARMQVVAENGLYNQLIEVPEWDDLREDCKLAYQAGYQDTIGGEIIVKERRDFPPKEKEVAKRYAEDETSRNAFIGLIKSLFMEWTPVVRTLLEVVSQMKNFMDNKSGGIPDYFQQIQDAEKAQNDAKLLREQ
ncbi:uncharacterized protein N7469_001927 [Penicillium citrinum]|uniref:Uncharacterized protein n=1 Tax=Penicillium citrinum TaxID=5077 RepID=A0A9W9TT29_PENCI|nr:uncharacterized protein N7469_001927 [Penicillium citrinum]KAJ5240336.1 hypothetical protein N7469_001927 [Penicillium citrinum]